MKNKFSRFPLLFILFLIFMAAIPLSSQQPESTLSRKERIERLSDIYRRWYDMVVHIASREEQSVFLQLDNERDREIFIRTFWLQRDPTPGTTANEFKDEIEERFRYVTSVLKRGASKPAWLTDMGRIYMVLGKPNSIDRNESSYVLYPTQIWYYFGDSSVNLPTYFNILFYRPNNTPEWKLYNPAIEDPRSLMVHNEGIGSEDYQTMYNKLHEFSPDLASAAFTMVPNQFQSGLRPSFNSNFILSTIYESPQKKVNVQYATNFLKYKGFVDMETSINYIENTHQVSLTRLERFGINILNIALKPKKISVDFSKEQEKYYYNFELTISIKKGDDFIFEQKKNYDFYMSGDEVETLKGKGMVISEAIPIIPGEFTVLVYAKNTVGKEFTYFENNIKVQPESDMPFLSSPLITTQIDEKEAHMLAPFQTDKKRISIDPERTYRVKETPTLLIGAYNISESLWNKGAIKVNMKGLSERVPFDETFIVRLNSQTFDKNAHYVIPLSKDGLYSDYYKISVNLVSENDINLDTQSTDFTVAPHRDVAYPISTFKQSRIDNTASLFGMLGNQYQNQGNLTQAAEYFQKALESDPEYHPGRVKWLETLNRMGKFTQSIVESEKLKGQKDFQFEYHLIRGTAFFGINDLNSAMSELLDANKQYNSDIRVLNLLGLTFFKQGNLEEAIKALEASLTLSSKQPQVQKILDDIKNKLPQGNVKKVK